MNIKNTWHMHLVAISSAFSKACVAIANFEEVSRYQKAKPYCRANQEWQWRNISLTIVK